MSTERDAGLKALQQGNPAAAAPLLEAAIQQNPADFDALLFLGAAYGQIGRQMDAINTITRAVQVQPANAQARYNLAVAMEQGGYREQAVTALGQALTLQPEYPKAREALQRLQGGTVAPPPVQAANATPSAEPSYNQAGSATVNLGNSPIRPPETFAVQATSEESGEPPMSGFGQVVESASPGVSPTGHQAPPAYSPAAGAGGFNPQLAPPAGYGSQSATAPPSGYGTQPPTGAGGYGAPTSAAPGGYNAQPAIGATDYRTTPGGAAAGYSAQPQPGQGQPVYGAPQPQSLTGETYSQAPPATGAYGAAPSPYAPPAANPYGAPAPSPYGTTAAGPYGQNTAYRDTATRSESYDDRFDPAQSAKDWLAILTKPGPFFSGMAGSTGMLAPMALGLLYCVPVILSILLSSSHIGSQFKGTPGLGPLLASGGVVVFLLVGVPIVVAGMFLSAWVIHLVGLLFGNKTPYSASFRALVYAYAPMPVINLLCSLIPIGADFQPNPIARLLQFAAFIWYLVLLVMAISNQQEISTGQAVGVVVISGIVQIIIFLGFIFALVLIAGIFIAAAGAASHGLIPMQ